MELQLFKRRKDNYLREREREEEEERQTSIHRQPEEGDGVTLFVLLFASRIK